MEVSREDTGYDLKAAVIKSVAFFDLFDFPLTPLEVLLDTESGTSLKEVRDILDSDQRLSEEAGFYFLRERAELIKIRKRRHNYSARKMAKAQKFAYLFRLFPGVQMIALANSMGFYNLRDDSDIDFFIITKPGWLWLSRLYCTGLAKVLASRPNQKTKRDKICLSFYLSASHLAIGSLKLPGGDPYFDRWLKQLVLLYNKNNTYQNFLQLNNQPEDNHNLVFRSNNNLGILERLARAFQLKVMPASLKEAAGNSDGVVISNQILKLYQRDRRREFEKKYAQKITALFGNHD